MTTNSNASPKDQTTSETTATDEKPGNLTATVPNEIVSYMHCGMCLKEIPDGVSPADWSDLEFGFTQKGLQVWCRRHDCNLIHIDFEGQQHPADTIP